MCMPLPTLCYIRCLTSVGRGGHSLLRTIWGHYDDLLTILDVVDGVGSLEEAMIFGVIKK